MNPEIMGFDDLIGDSSTTENVETASDDEVSGSNEEMSGSALPASAGMISSEALPVEETLKNKEDEEEDEVERRRQQEKGKDKVKGTFEIGGTSGPSSMDNVTLMTRRPPRQIEGAEGHHTGNESMQRDIREMHELLNQVIEQQGTSRGTGKGSTHTLQLQELTSSPIHDQNNQHYLKMIYELLTELLKSSLQHRDSVTQIQKQQDLQQECLTEIHKQHDLIQKQQDLIQKQQELNQKQQELNQACETQILKYQESQLKLLNEENKLHDYIQRQQELQQELIGCRLPHRLGKLGPLDSGTQVWDHWDRIEDDLMNILTEIRKIWKSFLAQQIRGGILALIPMFVSVSSISSALRIAILSRETHSNALDTVIRATETCACIGIFGSAVGWTISSIFEPHDQIMTVVYILLLLVLLVASALTIFAQFHIS